MKKLKHITLFTVAFSIAAFAGFTGLQKKQVSMNNAAVDKKVDELLKSMTLDEKIGQMTQVDIGALQNKEDITKYYLGSILAGGDSEIEDLTASGWSKHFDELQSYALKTRLKIPILYGIDAVHGHNNVKGAVVFPHNIGLGCSRNAKLIKKYSEVTAAEIAGTGINWAFAPCIAVARNERWGRTYESFGETPELSKMFASAAVKGLQGSDMTAKTSVLACAKHFLGDGGTTNGTDQGNTECDEAALRKLFLPGYAEAVKAGTGSIMVSYSSWNGAKMHANKYLLTDVLKGELKFKGFLVSDWAAIDQLDKDYKKDVEISINAGLDMIMIPKGPKDPNNYVEFIKDVKELVAEGKIKMERIDDAARRILRVKVQMDLWNRPYTDKDLLARVGSKEHREVARQCVQQSLVLLKNNNKVLPLSKDVKTLLVAGAGADNIGMQCGGWTISWQGALGDVTTGGTTILQGIKNTVSKDTKVVYSKDGSSSETAQAAIVVVGETPYAEMKGDKEDLSLTKEDEALIEKLKAKGIPVITVLLSGRPMIINKALDNSSAFVAAWLPGTEGQGVADVLFGAIKPQGKLSVSWPKDMKQIPINVGDKEYTPLFRYGYGLTY